MSHAAAAAENRLGLAAAELPIHCAPQMLLELVNRPLDRDSDLHTCDLPVHFGPVECHLKRSLHPDASNLVCMPLRSASVMARSSFQEPHT